MDASLSEKNANAVSLWRAMFRLPLPLERESALFVLVSALDLLLTCWLLGHGGQDRVGLIVYEWNPVADFFLNRWGVEGFVGFKFSMVALISVIAQFIALESVAIARRVLNFGNVVVAAVVIYSSGLLLQLASIP